MNKKANKALFLDRDGIINRERGCHTWRPEDFEINVGLIPFLQLAISRGFDLVIITNQSGIAKGLYSHEDVDLLHNQLQAAFLSEGIVLREIYYCPHHPENGFCICRKPDSLLIEKALSRFGYDPQLCFMIGDRDRDVQAAEKAGIRGVLVPSNPDFNQLTGLLA